MTSAVKQTTFDEYRQTLDVVLKHIDKEFLSIKNRQKNLSVWKGYKSYKDFIKDIESKALKIAASELNIADTTIKDRWHVLTLPAPVYCALESSDLTFSKVKPLTALHFDFENDNDASVAQEMVDKIISGMTVADIKKMVQDYATKVWNPSHIVIQRIAEQHGITENSMF